jgi:protein-S-isoprenylcysteine O-methyltransferase Ste14
MEDASDLIISGCWIIFLAYWFFSALKVKVIAEQQSLSSALKHRIFVGLAWFLLVFHNLPWPMNFFVTPRNDFTQIIGAAICLAGLFVTIWARRTLAGNWSADVTFKENHELIRVGPYRFVRHPIYTGLLLMCLGSALDIGRLRAWIALALMFIGFWIKLKQEEKLMLQHFPNDYPVYRRQVKALVPFVI